MTESSPDSSEIDRLIGNLRQELAAEDGDEAPEVRMLGPIGSVELSEPAALLIDEVMAETVDVEDDLRSRLISKVDERLAQRRRRAGRLEPLLKARRLSQELSVEDVSGLVDIEADEFRKLEDGLLSLTDQDEALIARWIKALEDDDGTALAALSRSVGPVPSVGDRAYAGESDEFRGESDFVAKVAEELKRLRGADGAGHSEPPR